MQVLVSKAEIKKKLYIQHYITENKGAHLIYFVFDAKKDIRYYKPKLDIENLSWNLKSR